MAIPRYTPSSPALHQPKFKRGQKTYPSAPGTASKPSQDRKLPLRKVIDEMNRQQNARTKSTDPIELRRGPGWKEDTIRRFEAEA